MPNLLIEHRNTISEPLLHQFVARSSSMKDFIRLVRQVVKSDATLLVLGETGVGKERLARAIHSESARNRGPFVAVNCGAFPETLLESELFGHERGAFTGATRQRRGIFEVADRGTVFLDEISEMPLHLQVKLLRVLQNRQFRRLGAEQPISIDVRIVAASNQDLQEAVNQKLFRKDLFYRLNVVALRVPPLRERPEDIPLIITEFFNLFRKQIPRQVYGITHEAIEALICYPWPGNIRELMNVIERTLLTSTNDFIEWSDLPPDIRTYAQDRKPSEPEQCSPSSFQDIPAHWFEQPIKDFRRHFLNRAERAYWTQLLTQTQGSIAKSAKKAGIQPRALFERMRLLGLKKESFTRKPSTS